MRLRGHPPAYRAPPGLRHLWRDRAAEKMRLKNQVAAPLAWPAPPTPRPPCHGRWRPRGHVAATQLLSQYSPATSTLMEGWGPVKEGAAPAHPRPGKSATLSAVRVAALAARESWPLPLPAPLDFQGPSGDNRNLDRRAPPPPRLSTLEGEKAAASRHAPPRLSRAALTVALLNYLVAPKSPGGFKRAGPQGAGRARADPQGVPCVTPGNCQEAASSNAFPPLQPAVDLGFGAFLDEFERALRLH